jgi:PIN domain nuclease of toxin-antitoxin system
METHQELYLDTHVPVWLYASGIQWLSARAVESLETAPRILISPMVALEIEYLYEIKKITQPSSIIVQHLAQHIGLSVCTKPFQRVATQALEMKWTRDPFDRLITAQASLDRSCLLTKDRTIHDHYDFVLW